MERERDILEREVLRQRRRRLWVRGLILGGLAATLGVVGLTYFLDKSHPQKSFPRPSELPRNVDQRLSGFTFTRSDGGRQVFTIHAARTLALKKGGTALLKDVYVEFYGRSGRRLDVLRTAEGVYNPSTNNLAIPGSVELILNAPKQLPLSDVRLEGEEAMRSEAAANPQSVYIETSKVISRDRSNLVESGTSVRFIMGKVSGSAIGLSYDAGKGQVILKRDVKAAFQPAQRGRLLPPIDLSASRLRYDDIAKKAELSGPVRVGQGNRMITANRGQLLLNPQNRITQVIMEGNAHASEEDSRDATMLSADLLKGRLDSESGQLRQVVAVGHVRGESRRDGTAAWLEANKARLNFSGPGQIPINGRVTGAVRLKLVQPSRPEKAMGETAAYSAKITREGLTTEGLRFAFRPGGRSLEEAETLSPGTLMLYPDSPKAGRRTATAKCFRMAFDEASHLKTLEGTGGTQITFAPAPGASDQEPSVTTARELRAVFDPQTELLRTVEQWGNFRFRNGNLEASAEKAHDDTQRQVVVLSGNPQVWDPTTRAQADQVVLKLGSGTAEGIGHVQAVNLDPEKDALPTNVVADRMIADRKSQVVHYEGHVRAWRGTDVVETSSLDVSKSQRRVSSPSRVITSHLQPASQEAGKGKGKDFRSSSLTIRADRLEYFDAGRKALYTGDVVMDTQDTRLRADRLAVYFTSDKDLKASQVERALASGHVLVTQPDRYAKGERATYDARTGKVVMTGGPPRLYDAKRGFTSGQRLTFFIHNDRLLVDGSPGSPTVSKHRVAQ